MCLIPVCMRMIAAGMLIDPVGTITVYYYCYDC